MTIHFGCLSYYYNNFFLFSLITSEVRLSSLVYQEFWVGNKELVDIYEKRLGAAGYTSFKLGRTNNRGDGRLSFVVDLKLSRPRES